MGRKPSYEELEQKVKELEQTRVYLKNVFANSADSIGIVDKHGRFTEWNKMSEELYGYTFEELKGKSFYDLYAEKNELEKMLEQLRRDGFVKGYEINMNKKDGSILPFEISIRQLKDDQHRTIGSVCVARNLSNTKRMLSDIAKANEELKQEIVERKRIEQEREKLIAQLQFALSEVKTLRGFLPICSSCKKIRDDKGYWNQIESYIRDHSEAEFSHSMCPECVKKLYPDLDIHDD